MTLTQPADVSPFVTAAVTATDAEAMGTYGLTDVTFLPDVISVFPGPASEGPWDWTAACYSVPTASSGCATGDPGLGNVLLNGNLWNLGSSAAGEVSMGTDASGSLDVQGTFSAAPEKGLLGDTWVRGYPNALYGISLGYPTASPPQSPSLELPMRLDDIPSDLIGTTGYSLTSSPPSYDVSYDMWLNPSKAMADTGQGTLEVMVWTDDSGSASYPPGTPISVTVPYSVDGLANEGVNDWDLYLSNIGTDGQTGGLGGSPAYGTAYFIPKNSLGAGAGQDLSIDLSTVFADLASVLQNSTYDWTDVAGTYWLDTIPFGIEFGPGGITSSGAADFSLDLSTYCLGMEVTLSKPGC